MALSVLIVLQCQWFFGSWDEDVTVPSVTSSSAELAPVTGVNNEMLLKAELMGLCSVNFLNFLIIVRGYGKINAVDLLVGWS